MRERRIKASEVDEAIGRLIKTESAKVGNRSRAPTVARGKKGLHYDSGHACPLVHLANKQTLANTVRTARLVPGRQVRVGQVSGDGRRSGYFASRSVKSFALEQQISSICRASTSALTLSASIFDASGCCFSSSPIRSLNEASSRRRRSISAFDLTGVTGFQTLCARMMRSPACHAFVNPNRGQKWKFAWRRYDRPGPLV
jgi:hypothetical protein